MTSTGFKSPWQGVWSLDAIVNRRIRRPRTTDVTMVIDTGLGASSLRDLLGLAGDHIDHWNFGFGTSALLPLSILEEKLALLDKHHIVTYTGGTLLEAAVVQEHCRFFMTRAAELGFGAVEKSIERTPLLRAVYETTYLAVVAIDPEIARETAAGRVASSRYSESF